MKKLRKYIDISKVSMSSNLAYIWSFLTKNLFLAFIIFVFLMLWKNIYSQKSGDIGGLSLNQMIWYLIFTEIIVLSRTNIHSDINNDIKNGNIAYLLNKPYNYILYCFSTSIGEMVIRLLANGIIGVLVGFLYVGSLKTFSIYTLPFLMLSMFLGSIINLLIYITLALSSFWLEENACFFWIYSKLVFTLGGMLIPLEFFPSWLKSICNYLPFAYVTYAPAKLGVDFSFSSFITTITIQLMYLLFFFLLALTVYRKGAKNLNVNGG